MRTWLSASQSKEKICVDTFQNMIDSNVAESLRQVTKSMRSLVSHAYVQSLDAIAAAPSHSEKQFVIFLKKGVYKEYAKIDKTMTNLVLIGEGMSVTTISGDRSNASGWATMKSATFDVRAQGFIAMDIGFENTAGPNNRQAVALSVGGDQSAFHRCKRHHRLYLPLRHGEDSTGFSLEYCSIEADFDLAADVNSTPTYLGRPWGKYARTEFMKSSMSASVSNRVTWPGYHVITEASNADSFTVAKFIGGNSWLPSTGVPFAPGL
ncbi:hypothetical protein L3X38_014017 [Prunus dulcis]|uniref:Pectinesterase catalytic domain-containing protein n=1 Tax=Prunus dulcis TaxID=3755 RepID=A0AAD4WMZ2_PRUDU|nr:hypothetical protein L3X38_014017 [Prunus dulcis]